MSKLTSHMQSVAQPNLGVVCPAALWWHLGLHRLLPSFGFVSLGLGVQQAGVHFVCTRFSEHSR